MTIVNALHGRARMRAAFRQRLGLAALLAVAFGVLALDRLCFVAAYRASRSDAIDPAADFIFTLDRVVICAAPLIGAFLIERFGVKRSIGLAVLAWCALTTLAAVSLEPLTFRIVTPLVTYLLPGILLVGTLVVARLAWPARRRAVWVAALLLLYRASGSPYALFRLLFGLPDTGDPASWPYRVFALVTAGTAIFAIWILGFREIDRANGLDLRPSRTSTSRLADWRAVLTNPAVWTIVAIETCVAIVHSWSLKGPWFGQLNDEALSGASLTILFGTPVAFLVAAVISDRLYRQHRSWARARRPLLALAFITTAAVAFIGLAARQSGPTLAIIDTLALGVLQIGYLLVVDTAPRRRATPFIGAVLALEVLVATYIAPWLAYLVPYDNSDMLLVIVFGALGAILTALLLPRLTPETD